MNMENTNTPNPSPVKWYHYIAAFWAGAFFANVVPHFVNGVSGDPFPSPFADPPGKGLSSPLVNVLWALFNALVGYLLLRASKTCSHKKGLLLTLFIGAALFSIMLSLTFVDKVR